MMNGDRLHTLRMRRNGWDYELSRRRFLQLVGASGAVGYTACSEGATEKILPYTRQPVDVTPGVPTTYATSFLIEGYATGLIAQTREGRPIKIEGNPEHPASLGATSAYHQAAVLQLYDVDRAAAVVEGLHPRSWDALLHTLLRSAGEAGGKAFRILLEPTSSPLLHELVAQVKQRLPGCRVTFYAPLHTEHDLRGTERLFGTPLAARYDFDPVRCVVSLESDFLASPYDLSHARRFAANRAPAAPTAEMIRMYAVEAALSVTGSMADHRLSIPPSRIGVVAAALAAEVLPSGSPGMPALRGLRDQLDPRERTYIEAVARDLRARPPGTTLIVPGDRQPPEVHVLTQAMNLALGNVGRTVHFTAPVVPAFAGDQPLPALVREMRDGHVDTLLVIGGNPAYDAPADLDWARAVAQVPRGVYVAPYRNETARGMEWFGPLAHPFEIWGDGRGPDGTYSVVQPLIRPLVDARSATQVLGVLAGEPNGTDHMRMRSRFGNALGESLTASMSQAERIEREDPRVRTQWEELLARGFAPGSAFPPLPVEAREAAVERAAATLVNQPRANGLELSFMASPTVLDGRFANVSWLLELPAPITKLTWGNAALLSATTAAQVGLGAEASIESDAQPWIEVKRGDRVMRIPALIAPGHADGAVTVWLGYGHEGGERLAEGVGVDAYPLRTLDALWFAPSVRVVPLGERFPLAITQKHLDQHGRTLALVTTAAYYREHPEFTEPHKGPLPSLLPESNYEGMQWAMTIDLSRCTGCSSCMVACQAENNVLVVGPEQVRRGREMHWLRIDTYLAETPAGPEVVHQPMLCQHCEKAPCEYVCPVNATVHSPDGLNEMVYNRCIGTRFCSNNCPYKVRRFNWFDWIEHQETNQGRVMLQRNPEVTVRERGVMEKCTYCVQRIRSTEIEARKERRPIRPGEVVTACQQACPTEAIVFGSLDHEATPVVQWRQQPRSYAALHETNARPRTMYLARINNLNPELAT